jgi:hypothetical protein
MLTAALPNSRTVVLRGAGHDDGRATLTNLLAALQADW